MLALAVPTFKYKLHAHLMGVELFTRHGQKRPAGIHKDEELLDAVDIGDVVLSL